MRKPFLLIPNIERGLPVLGLLAFISLLSLNFMSHRLIGSNVSQLTPLSLDPPFTLVCINIFLTCVYEHTGETLFTVWLPNTATSSFTL